VENPIAGTTYTWYQDPEGTTILNTGINYTTGAVAAPTTFYVAANDGLCPMNSALTPVVIHFPVLDSPIVMATHADFSSVTFSWSPVSGAAGYEVSVNAGSYIIPSSGSIGLTHTVSGLSNSQPVTITVKAIPSAQFCGNASYGHGSGSTYGVGFYVPSAFTPNGDTRNDILKPIVPFGSILEYFTIYNRWGKLIFTTNKNGVGWDGKVQGKDQPVGTYVWICRYLFAGKTEILQSGSVTLLR
jgi:gliding motility-associated-like protein